MLIHYIIFAALMAFVSTIFVTLIYPIFYTYWSEPIEFYQLTAFIGSFISAVLIYLIEVYIPNKSKAEKSMSDIIPSCTTCTHYDPSDDYNEVEYHKYCRYCRLNPNHVDNYEFDPHMLSRRSETE